MKKIVNMLGISIVLLFVFVLPVIAKEFPVQSNVPLDKEWRVKFNFPIDPSTLQSNIVLWRTQTDASTQTQVNAVETPIIPVIDQTNLSVVILRHTTPFIAGATYNLIVKDEVKSLSGISLANSSSLKFSTLPALMIYPMVISRDPMPNAQSVETNKVITITFSEPIKEGDSYSSISLIGANSNTVGITKEIWDNTLTITPTQNLTNSTKYNVIIPSKAVSNLAGNQLATAEIVGFTVKQEATTPNKVYEEAVVTKVLWNTDDEVVSLTAFASGKQQTFKVDEVTGFQVSEYLAKGDTVVLEFNEDNATLVKGIATAAKDITNNGTNEYGSRVMTGLSVKSVDAGNRQVTFTNNMTYQLADGGLVLDGTDDSDITEESLSDLHDETNVTVVLDKTTGQWAKFFVIEPVSAVSNKVYEEAVVTKVLWNTDNEVVSLTAFANGKQQTFKVDEVTGFEASEYLAKGDTVVLEFDEDNATLVKGIATAAKDITNNGANEYGSRVMTGLSVKSVDAGNRQVTFTNNMTYQLADGGLVLDGTDDSDITVESLSDLHDETNVTVVLDETTGQWAKFFVILA